MLLPLMVLSMLSAAPVEVDSPVEAMKPEPNWSAGIALGGGLLGPIGEVNGERRLSHHLSLTLGLQASVTQYSSSSFATLGVSPGLRFYFTNVFRGGWVGAQFFFNGYRQVSEAYDASTGADLGPTAAIEKQIGGALNVGYTFQWDNGFLLSLSAGPTLRAGLASGLAGVGGPSFGVGLQAFAGLGVAL